MSLRRIAVFTGTRAEYGLLYWVMSDIAESVQLELKVIAAAMHFSPDFGETWREIVADGFTIDARVEMLLSSDTRTGVAKSIGLGTIGMADALERLAPDALVILGDRFEALSAAQAALVMGIPIVHLHGGEVTEGAFDDSIRHAITKMASLHFTSTEAYRRRIVQMGEDPERVVVSGALGLDHLARGEAMAWDEVCASLNADLSGPMVLATYHPATNADEDPATTARAMLAALDRLPDHQILLTYPNADNGSRAIIAEVEAFAAARAGRVVAVPSLGFRRYLAVMSKAEAVVGNSSSGLIEAPSFGIPTVDIGARQQGRIAARSVIHCAADERAISVALDTALSAEHRALSRSVINPYGGGDAAARIVAALETKDLAAPKRFHDQEPWA